MKLINPIPHTQLGISTVTPSGNHSSHKPRVKIILLKSYISQSSWRPFSAGGADPARARGCGALKEELWASTWSNEHLGSHHNRPTVDASECESCHICTCPAENVLTLIFHQLSPLVVSHKEFNLSSFAGLVNQTVSDIVIFIFYSPIPIMLCLTV